MKIEFAYRKVLMLDVDSDGHLTIESVKEYYPEAIENGTINHVKLILLLIDAVKEIDKSFNHINNIISEQEQRIRRIEDARSLS